MSVIIQDKSQLNDDVPSTDSQLPSRFAPDAAATKLHTTDGTTNSSVNKPPLIIIAGPTASGKSAAAVELAKRFDGEVISADSMQVYRGMDIGSAKITEEEMQGIPHHLIDIIDPKDPWNVVRFQQEAKAAAKDIAARGKLPILAGGTGFYIQSLLYDIDFSEMEEDNAYRKSLEDFAAKNGAEALHQKLLEVDPKAAAEIHPNNIKRVVRALEFHHESGQAISDHNETQRLRPEAYNAVFFVLTMERQKLYKRIDDRVDLMMRDGLLDEVKRLLAKGCAPGDVAMQGLGYKQLIEYVNGACTLEEAIYQIKVQTHRFAKRQVTWFKREPNVIWIDRDQYPSNEAMLAEMERIIKNNL